MNKNLNLLFIKILLLLTIQFGFSQNNNIEKSIFEVETGLFGDGLIMKLS